MPSFPYRPFLSAGLLLALAACSMPTEPEGIHEEGLTRLAEKLQAQGDDVGAVDFYQRSLQRKPDDVTALKNLGDILLAHGQIEMAEANYAHALRVEPDNQNLRNAEGRVLIMQGRYAEARDVFAKAVEEDKHDTKARNGLGIALDYLGQHDEAEAQYRKVLDETPDDLVTLNNLAHSYMLAGRYDQAIAVLEPHAADKKATPQLRQNLAEAYGMSGMFADAERLARMDLKPDEVKRNLAFYRARRAKLALEPRLVADLGSYPTRQMAEANAEKVTANLSDKTIDVGIKSDVQSIGGTPVFLVQASGFKNADALNAFCQDVYKTGIACKSVKGN